MNKKYINLTCGISLLVLSLTLTVLSVLENRLEFFFIAMIGAVGSGEGIKRFAKGRKHDE